MKQLVAQLVTNTISRRDFVRRLVATGVTATAANSVADAALAMAQAPGAPASPEAIRVFTGTGGEHFAEQLIASGVKYIFGNCASEDAHFYEALVDRPQLQYILTPHEGRLPRGSERKEKDERGRPNHRQRLQQTCDTLCRQTRGT